MKQGGGKATDDERLQAEGNDDKAGASIKDAFVS
jgi:uncharacterized protein YjbJ (UPF0337 family)